MSGETANFHARYLYRDYLQVAECDLTGETPEVVRSYIWDPSEPEATRVLSMMRWEVDGTQEKEHLYCMHDAMKNITSLFGEARGRRALYEYRPYGGLITSEGNMAEENKFRFSSEYMDGELGLVYHRKSFGILYGIQAASGMFRVQFLCKRVEKDLPLSAFREERKAGAQPEELIFS